MALTARACASKLALLDRKRAKLRTVLSSLSAQHRAWSERFRSLMRTEARRLVKKLYTGSKQARGRPSRYPGLCRACMMRHNGQAGGPPHDKLLCKKTQRHIKKA